MNNSCYPSMLVKSTWGDDYDIALYGRLGLHCHNFHKVNCDHCIFMFFFFFIATDVGNLGNFFIYLGFSCTLLCCVKHWNKDFSLKSYIKN